MKGLGGLLGLLVALGLIYWLRPLKPAAVILVTVVCVGLGVALGQLLPGKNDVKPGKKDEGQE